MKVNRSVLLGGVTAVAISFGGLAALAAGFLTNGLPTAGGSQYPSTLPLTGNETIPADTNLSGGQSPQSEAITTKNLAGYERSLSGFGEMGNYLIGGDSPTNLWQRGTTGSSVTTTFTYGGPDRWAYWSGTNTAMTVSRTTTAGDLPAQGHPSGFKMARTAGQTGTVQMCMTQVIESAWAYRLQGQTVELDFTATAGATFSPTNSLLQVYVTTGTGVDEGGAKMAFGLNAGGGGTPAWTGQANALAGSVAISTTNTKYVAVAAIPATATEVAVSFCFTPVGTAGATDYVALSAIQLVRNPTLSALAGTVQASTQVQSSAFAGRSPGIEAALQQRFYWQQTEAASSSVVFGLCQAVSTTSGRCVVRNPVQMRAAPTPVATFGTLAVNVAGTPTALTALAATSSASTTDSIALTTTVASGQTAGQVMVLQGGNSTGGGAIGASAEL